MVWVKIVLCNATMLNQDPGLSEQNVMEQSFYYLMFDPSAHEVLGHSG